MQRSMSYRKPAPVFIPSPPPSPVPSIRLEVDKIACEDEEQPLPPLPHNWREIVAAKIVEINTEAVFTGVTGSQDKTTIMDGDEIDITELKSLPDLPSANVDGDQESLNTQLGSRSLAQSLPPRTERGRGLPTDYRPPTPPLRSQSKQSRRMIQIPADKNSEAVTLYSQTNSSRHLARHAFNNYTGASAGPASMKPSASFRTERTMVSMNTNLSMGWANGLGNSSDRGMYSVPTLLMQKQTARANALVIVDDASDDSCHGGILCCWPKTGFCAWAKKLRDLKVTSKRVPY